MRLNPLAWARGVALRRRYDRLALAHIEERLLTIQATLDAAAPGAVMVAGNSHAELVGDHGLGDVPLVNAGIGGMSTRGCARYLPQLRMPVRAGVAVLFAGSNDIMARARPLSQKTAGGFEEAVSTILVWLTCHAKRVVVLAVPPIEPLPLIPRDVAAVANYSARLERLADRHECLFADPFASLRDGDSGLAKPGTLSDGVHLADYGPLASWIAALARSTASPTPNPAAPAAHVS